MIKVERAPLVDWALLGPPLRQFRRLRRWVRKQRFYASPPQHIDLCGKEAALSRGMIGVVAFNRPDVIEWQIHLVRRHLTERDGYFVVDNSNDQLKRDAIRELCRREAVPYVGLPRNPFTLSASHGASMNWVCRNVVSKYRPRLFGFLDHDIFPTERFSVTEKLQDKQLYGLKTEVPAGWHLWAGFCFFDGSIRAEGLDFMPAGEYRMDSGGGNWPILYRNIEEARAVFASVSLERFQRIDGWLHVGNASHWREEPANRAAALKQALTTVSGDERPRIELDRI